MFLGAWCQQFEPLGSIHAWHSTFNRLFGRTLSAQLRFNDQRKRDLIRSPRGVNSFSDVTITFETEPATATREAVLSGLRGFNREHAVAPDFQPVTLAARAAAGEIVGGLVGETGWAWLHVDLLWIAAPYRGRGLGRALLRSAEQEATHRGCHYAYLDTFDFQALPFYEREGYNVFGIQDDYPPGYKRYYLRKALVSVRDAVT